jgi:hypothetical protein
MNENLKTMPYSCKVTLSVNKKDREEFLILTYYTPKELHSTEKYYVNEIFPGKMNALSHNMSIKFIKVFYAFISRNEYMSTISLNSNGFCGQVSTEQFSSKVSQKETVFSRICWVCMYDNEQI